VTLRTTLTLAVLVAVLVAGSVVGWRLATEDLPGFGTGGGDCRTEQVESKLTSDEVTVNVYNAGTISGLASSTMRSLGRHGFIAGIVENAPPGTRAKNVVLLDPEPKSAEVRLVKQQFKGKVDVRGRSDDLSDGVDIILGDGFKGVDDKAKDSVTVTTETEVCPD